jgi:hypothetical protein
MNFQIRFQSSHCRLTSLPNSLATMASWDWMASYFPKSTKRKHFQFTILAVFLISILWTAACQRDSGWLDSLSRKLKWFGALREGFYVHVYTSYSSTGRFLTIHTLSFFSLAKKRAWPFAFGRTGGISLCQGRTLSITSGHDRIVRLLGVKGVTYLTTLQPTNTLQRASRSINARDEISEACSSDAAGREARCDGTARWDGRGKFCFEYVCPVLHLRV